MVSVGLIGELKMVNLLEETRQILSENGKTIFDVVWLGTDEHVYDCDIQELFNFNYYDGFGGAEIPMDLIVAGDNWWLERHEYDGSEWWEFKTMPSKPLKIKSIAKLVEYR